MNSSYGTHYLVRFKDNRLWSFYSDDKNNIYYKPLIEDDNWGDPSLVLSKVRNEFGLCMDEYEKLHIICLSYKGEIFYLHYDGSHWSKHVLSQYDTKKYDIRYPTIIELDHRIHIIFAIGDIHHAGDWSLCHYCWDGGQWVHRKIAKFTINQDIRPFRYDLHHHDIHLAYHGISGDELKLFHIRYHHDLQKWLTSPDNPSIDSSITLSPKSESEVLEHILDWTNKAEVAYQDHLSIVREVDELHRRSMESKRQWELTLDELEQFKAGISKLRKKSPLKSFFESILH